jgi:hypothetical protein
MSLKLVAVNPTLCHVRSIALMAVKTCSKPLSAHSGRHGKSPCFLRLSVLKAVSVDCGALDSASVNVATLLE